jgi:hypothetical protein
MKIKIGDRVRFLNDIGEGRVVGFQRDNIVEVRTGDGWDIPYPLGELIVVTDDESGISYKPSPPDNMTPEKPSTGSLGESSGKFATEEVSALFVRLDDDGRFAGLKIYLVNESDSMLEFTFFSVTEGKINLILKDSLEPGTKILLDEPGLEALSGIKGWHFQGFFHSDIYHTIPPVIDMPVIFNVKKFSSPGAYGDNDYLHDPAIIFHLLPDSSARLEGSLADSDLMDIINQKEKKNIELNQPKVFQSGKQDKPPREIDLHINQLVDRVVGLSNSEILNIQMGTFHRELNRSIASSESSLIFIHGIGNGTLKQELRKAIDTEYDQCDFEDASFKEYGFGATMVRIRQNK